jgi:protein ImuA
MHPSRIISDPAREERLAALRAEVRAIESPAGRGAGLCLPFGLEAIDRRLADGGLAVAALHEAAADRPGLPDEAATSLFLASIAARREGAVLWALARRDLFAPGLAGVGLKPGRVLYAECGRDEDVLAVMEEGLRHGGLAAVIGEARRVGMAATRRLQLAAEEGGTPALMLRRRRKAAEDPLAAPSAAVTRWRVASAPSAPLPAPGIGRARWHLILARQRGGEPHDWILEAPNAEARLTLPAGAQHRAGETRAAA